MKVKGDVERARLSLEIPNFGMVFDNPVSIPPSVDPRTSEVGNEPTHDAINTTKSDFFSRFFTRKTPEGVRRSDKKINSAGTVSDPLQNADDRGYLTERADTQENKPDRNEIWGTQGTQTVRPQTVINELGVPNNIEAQNSPVDVGFLNSKHFRNNNPNVGVYTTPEICIHQQCVVNTDYLINLPQGTKYIKFGLSGNNALVLVSWGGGTDFPAGGSQVINQAIALTSFSSDNFVWDFSNVGTLIIRANTGIIVSMMIWR